MVVIKVIDYFTVSFDMFHKQTSNGMFNIIYGWETDIYIYIYIECTR